MASAIILLPFYQQYLSNENFGALSIYLAFAILVQVLTTYSFDTGIYVFFHEYKTDVKRLRLFISSVFVFVAMIGIGMGTFFLFSGNFLFTVLFEEQTLEFFPFGLMAVVTGVFQSLFKIHSSLLQSSERPQLFLWSNLLSFSLIAGFTITGLCAYPQSLWGPVGGRMLAALASGIWAFLRVIYSYGFRFDYRYIKSTFSFNNSSFIYQLQQWSVNYLDRFIMIFFLPLATIGIYDFAVKCMLALEFIISGLYNSFYPKVIGAVMRQQQKKSTPEINRYYHGLIAVVMVLVCLAVLFFTLIVDVHLIHSGYELALQYLPLIGIVYLIRVIRYYFAFPYGALKYSKPLPVIYTVISLFKFAMILLLIEEYEVYSVIMAAVLSSLLEILLLWYFIRAKFEFNFNKLKILLAPLLLAVIIGLFEWFHILATHLMYGLYIVLCAMILGLLYRNEIKVLGIKKSNRS